MNKNSEEKKNQLLSQGDGGNAKKNLDEPLNEKQEKLKEELEEIHARIEKYEAQLSSETETPTDETIQRALKVLVSVYKLKASGISRTLARGEDQYVAPQIVDFEADEEDLEFTGFQDEELVKNLEELENQIPEDEKVHIQELEEHSLDEVEHQNDKEEADVHPTGFLSKIKRTLKIKD